ncbi:NAD(P)H-hydrate epimerase [Agromyces seonyuensis]|uniref:NAD(P)H-hydrate epimerase n=1 Tax=Agromyces seonyuensis TaxID=2662446 RepID=A0A6I4NZ30_9MICO|nr:NAD(P)H-hydrate epimerase [Agromyces seonyuensis]MWB96999.1 NAD(P)H-hydrate epimerase [Agromyces seonyuensis]
MPRGYTSAAIRAIERAHLDAGEPLMQRAAAALADELRALLDGRPADRRILLLAGGGDNGGDALYAGAALAADGARVELLRTSPRIHEGGLAAALAAGVDVAGIGVDDDAEAASDAAERAASADLVVDGLVGLGASGPLRGRTRAVVLAVAGALDASPASERPLVVAVDLPSGLDADTGTVGRGEDGRSAVLPADVTVTMLAMKAGFLREPGRSLAGRVLVADLGLAADFDALPPDSLA